MKEKKTRFCVLPVVAGLASLLFGQACARGVVAEGPWAEVIVTNAKVITVDSQFRIAQAFGIKNGRFVGVGSAADVMALQGPATQVIDLGGRIVMPGFNDGHLHGGARLEDQNRQSLGWPKTIDEMMQRIAAVAGRATPGEWLDFASDWHPSTLQERRFPTRWELDKAAPNNPVFIIRGGQTAVVNSLALKLAGITKNTMPPEGVGKIEKDVKTGEPTGLLLANALFLVQKVMPKREFDMERVVKSIIAKNAIFNSEGITSARDAGLSPDEIRGFQEVRRRGQLTVRSSLMYQPPTREEPLESVLPKIRAFGPVTGLGDEWLRIDGLKLYLDGGMESAYLKEPFVTDSSYYGLKNYTPEKLQALVKEANRLGWSVGTHAVGDAALEMALDAYEAANAEKSIVGRRWTVEHPFMLVSDANIERAKRLGIIASAQSWHVYRYGYPMVTQWGKERANVALPFKSWIEKNVTVAGGSDAAGDPTFPNIQFLLMWAEVTRDSEQSGKLGPQEAITREQAIRLHTQAPAYLTFEESLKGSIEPGKLADYIILSDDILTVPEDKLKTLEVLTTVVGGRQVYSKPGIELGPSLEAVK